MHIIKPESEQADNNTKIKFNIDSVEIHKVNVKMYNQSGNQPTLGVINNNKTSKQTNSEMYTQGHNKRTVKLVIKQAAKFASIQPDDKTN